MVCFLFSAKFDTESEKKYEFSNEINYFFEKKRFETDVQSEPFFDKVSRN